MLLCMPISLINIILHTGVIQYSSFVKCLIMRIFQTRCHFPCNCWVLPSKSTVLYPDVGFYESPFHPCISIFKRCKCSSQLLRLLQILWGQYISDPAYLFWILVWFTDSLNVTDWSPTGSKAHVNLIHIECISVNKRAIDAFYTHNPNKKPRCMPTTTHIILATCFLPYIAAMV